MKAQGCNSYLLFALAHSNRQLSLAGIEALLFPIIAFHFIKHLLLHFYHKQEAMSINDKKFQQISTFFLHTPLFKHLVHVIINNDLGG
jgi:hypothetical protein